MPLLKARASPPPGWSPPLKHRVRSPPVRRSSSAPFIPRRNAVSPVRRGLSAPVGGTLSPEHPQPPLGRPSAAPAAARAALAPAPSAVLRSSGSSSGPRSVRAATWAGWVQPPAWRAAAAWLLAVTSCALRALPPPLLARRPSRAPLRPCPPVPPCAALSGGPCASRPQTQRDKTGGTFCASASRYTKAPFCIVAALSGVGALKLLPLWWGGCVAGSSRPAAAGEGMRGLCPRRPRARRLAEGTG